MATTVNSEKNGRLDQDAIWGGGLGDSKEKRIRWGQILKGICKFFFWGGEMRSQRNIQGERDSGDKASSQNTLGFLVIVIINGIYTRQIPSPSNLLSWQ